MFDFDSTPELTNSKRLEEPGGSYNTGSYHRVL